MRKLPVGWTSEVVLGVWNCTVLRYRVLCLACRRAKWRVLRLERETLPWVLLLPNGDPWETGN